MIANNNMHDSRFILNIPSEERSDIIRIMFQLELAHWFYLDLLVEENPSLPKLLFKPFCQIIFCHIPFLRTHLSQLDQVVDKFREYKSNVPTYGCIILDTSMEKVGI